MKVIYESVEAAYTANVRLGYPVRSADAEEFNGTRIETGIIDGRYWVESGYRTPGDEDSYRVYSAMACTNSGEILVLEDFDTLAAAEIYIGSRDEWD